MSDTTAVEAPPAAPARPKRISDRARAERKLGWMLCAPAAIVMIAVTAYPIGYAIYLSLLRADLRFPDEKTWVGLNNYITVLTSSVWWRDVWHTVVITGVSVGIELVLGMLLALVMHRAIFGRGAIRTAALVPDELHEAAKVDGAGTWQRFVRITLPLMKPAILVALLFRTLDAFRIFDTVFITTAGQNNTETVSPPSKINLDGFVDDLRGKLSDALESKGLF